MDMTLTLPLLHRFVPGTDQKRSPLLLLHGTGGNEDDLMPLGRAIAPGAALLSPRGAVLENGMPRFFRRLAEGVFDEADLRRRTADLAAFIAGARQEYGLGEPIAVGFSNGANIAAALLMLHPGILAGAALLRAMVPFRQQPVSPPDTKWPGTPVLLLSGMVDPIVPAIDASQLAQQLKAAGAAVEHRVLLGGHELSEADVQAVSAWLGGQAR